MKKAIALFSTLLILVLVMMLMSIALKNTTNIKKTSVLDRYLIQENITIADIKKILDEKISSKIKSIDPENRGEALKLLFSTPLKINNSVDNSEITITLMPNDGKLNINYIIKNEYQKYITRIFDKIGIKDSSLLLEIILANIVYTNEHNDNYKIALKDLDFKSGLIRKFDDFKKVIDLYVKYSDDFNARNINYTKYFKFINDSNERNNILDINYMEIELLDALEGLSIKNSIRTKIKNKSFLFKKFEELELVEEGAVNEEELLRSKKIEFTTKNTICKINIKSINYSVQYIFNYDIENNKLSKISMGRWVY